jgi:hypothetical protein
MQGRQSHKSLPSPRPSQKIFGDMPADQEEGMEELLCPLQPMMTIISENSGEQMLCHHAHLQNRDSMSLKHVIGAEAELPHPSPPFLCNDDDAECDKKLSKQEIVAATTVDQSVAKDLHRSREQEYFEKKAREKEEENARAAMAEAALPLEERERLQRDREQKMKHDERKRAALKQGMQLYAGPTGSALNKFKKMPTKRRVMKAQ